MSCYNGTLVHALIDTHAHLDEVPDLEQALADARSADVAAIVAVGSDHGSNLKTLEIARRHRRLVLPALGLHPWSIKGGETERTLDFIEAHVGEAAAIGEIGLDYHKRVVEVAPKDLQKRVLAELLRIARRHDKPVLVHSRYAWRDALSLVEESGVERAVFHWFTGPSSVLRDIIGRGHYISATPAAEYHEEHRRAVRDAPLDRLLLETDSPVTYRRGLAGEFEARPADLRRSLTASAALREVPEETIAEAATGNTARIFGLRV